MRSHAPPVFMKLKKILNIASILIIITVFSLALWVLHNELKSVNYGQVKSYFNNTPLFKILLAVIFSFLSYFSMTFYDFFATKYVNHNVPYRNLFVPSFISISFGQNIGSAILTSSSLRYRLYNVLGFSGVEITKVILFCSLTFWSGFLFLGGIFFTVNPIIIPSRFNLPFRSVHALGIIFIAATVIYLLFSLIRKKIKIKKAEFSMPDIRLSAMQIFVSSTDLLLSCLTLFFLLPDYTQVPFFQFFSVYLVGIIIGMLSTVPGGIGVFESIMVVFLSGSIQASSLFGAMLIYRVIYYIGPLVVAMLLLAFVEVYRKKKFIKRIMNIVQRFMPDTIPIILAVLILVGGVILLFSGATPSILDRISVLAKFVPLPFIEVSHFISGIIGVNLLLCARGIQKKLDGAYFVSIILLSFGIIFSLLKGFDYEEAIFLGVVLILLIPNRKLFYRRTSLTSEPFSLNWILGISLIIISVVWFGFFSYKAVEYSHDLWWKFDIYHDAPRFLRSTAGIVLVLLIFGIARLEKSSRPRIELIPYEDIEKALPIVKSSRETYAYLALLKDKSLLFDSTRKGFIMYSVRGRVWASMGDPVGDEEVKKELIARFREDCDRHNGIPVFYEISRNYLTLYLDLGFDIIKYGEDAKVNLASFNLEGPKKSKLRYALRNLEREGYTFEVIGSQDVKNFMPKLREISDEWLENKNTREKKFSMGFFDESYLENFDFAIAKQNGVIKAFTNIWAGAEKEEISIDLMRYSNDAHNGIMDYLFTNLILWSKNAGFKYFNLGMAPLSGLDFTRYSSLWNKIASMLYSTGQDFYNFQGLKFYKDKFQPEWHSKYIAYTAGQLPFVLTSISSIVSSGFKGVISK